MEAVDAAIGAVNEVVASGMNWKGVENLIKEEAENGNPIAGVIKNVTIWISCYSTRNPYYFHKN